MLFNFEVYAVDFDGTLFTDGHWPEVGEPNWPLINRMKKERANGNKILLWTCRGGEALSKAIQACNNVGLYFDAYNTNIPEVIAYFGGDGRKPYADYYIDDKAALPEDFEGDGTCAICGEWIDVGTVCDNCKIEFYQ